VQADERRCAGRFADEQSDVLGAVGGGAESRDLAFLRPAGRELRARDETEPFGALGGADRFSGDLGPIHRSPRDEQGREQSSETRQRQRRLGCGRIVDRSGAEGTLERCREIQRRVGDGTRGLQIEPQGAFDANRPDRHAVALIGELEGGGTAAGNEEVGAASAIEAGEPLGVGRFDGEKPGGADRDRGAAAQRLDRRGDGARVFAQMRNSVTSGTWSDGRSQPRQGSCTVWLIASAATSLVAHI
jgi:hypothetical protein